MNLIVKILAVVVMAIMGLVTNMDLSTHARATKYLKEDLEIAVHDAALHLDQLSLAQGKFAFDYAKAKEAFKESFNENTGLTESDYEIIEFEVLDESNSVFPVTYNATSLNFQDTFTSPTIVAIIETNVDKYFNRNSEHTVRRVASYTYKVNLDRKASPPTTVIEGIVANENGLFWVVPFTRNITSPFDPNRFHPIKNVYQPHNGVDIAIEGILNKPVVSATNGKVIFAGTITGYGNIVIVDHGGGFETRYAHLNSMNVTKGQEVVGGQVIGLVGSTGYSTGPHLHFETRINGVPYDPMIFYP
ncbi:M23 family metallopeptidase [Robertmurraya massiliosenegalensis]|uniref:M23 family metallopeptidase n=1 Tax=Robertmurraya massiliosenegalensis TaxID=1287657 RepID=UPI00030DBDE1|nr:M23 family metallopeptidase [Robertmurraya massiliosenegalensis]